MSNRTRDEQIEYERQNVSPEEKWHHITTACHSLTAAQKRKFRKHADKGTWRHSGHNVAYLLDRAAAEIEELRKALHAAPPGDEGDLTIWDEAADAANFVMMAADIATFDRRPLRERVASLLTAHEFPYSVEADLRDKMAAVLTGWLPNALVRTEVPNNDYGADRARFDIVVVERDVILVIEVKIKGSIADLLRQVDRYAKNSWTTEIMVATPLKRLSLDFPEKIRDKVVTAVYLGGALG